MGMMDSYKADESGGDPGDGDNPDEETSEFEDAARTVFDDSASVDERVAALHDAIRACYAEENGGDNEGDESGPSKGPGKDTLALIFGGKGKK